MFVTRPESEAAAFSLLSKAPSASSKRWFAAFITPRHEKYVAEGLAERGVEAFLPLYQVTKQWKKSRPVTLDLPLFPTYVFVHIERQLRGKVLNMPGVLSIVGSSREDWPLPDHEIEFLRRGTESKLIQPHPYFKVGERVRIKSGIMSGAEGVLTRNKNDVRVILTFDEIMKSVSVEVDVDNLEMLPGSLSRTA